MLLEDVVADALAELGGEGTVPDLVKAAKRRAGPRVSRAAVEKALHAGARFTCDDQDPRRPRWSLVAAADARSAADPVATGTDAAGGTRAALDALALRDWQVEAFASWSAAGCRGVVEAVTGTGKTRLAVAVLRSVVGASGGTGRGVVLVPTLELLEQWVRELRSALPERRVGRLGGGHDDDLFACDVVVATPHSAAAVPLDLPPGATGVLIADEAHRYGAPTWGAALRDEFTLRLALTATYERADDGVDDVLAPYFGEVVTRYGFARAVAEGTVAPFRLGLVGVPLTADERIRHDRADLRVKQLHRELVGVHGMSRDPRRRFEAVAAIVAEAERTGRAGPHVAACREYLVRVRERRDVAAQAAAKLEVCTAVAAELAGRRTLVFTDTVDQAEAAAVLLRRAGREARTVHGDLAADERRIRLALFRRGDVDVVVAPRVLDEGVDVPDADVAVVLATFRTRRQLVQRLGRVLRVKSDGREARLLLAHAVDTAEDPARGGHADFLDDVRDVAREVVRLDLAADPAAVAAFLAPTSVLPDGQFGPGVRFER
ncbi:DEAD/DEAH box helicase [Nitriliruptor alkaliphilus]|uniref:DEAD/DEAH box helicase n=1 Tax=Nitriliruptor alkaliphilus TaxID=427918 RepID=UPI000696FB80|nr:DEAD/DEAH box helicase [Nitriliruptor alkaliphilus]